MCHGHGQNLGCFPPKKNWIIWSVDLPGGTSVRRCLGGANYVFLICPRGSMYGIFTYIGIILKYFRGQCR